MLFCVCFGGEMVKANGSIEYKGGRVITEIMNMHIPYAEFVSIILDRMKVESTSVKMYYTCKFDPSMLVLSEDDAKMRKCLDSMTIIVMCTRVRIPKVIPLPSRYTKFS